MMFAFIAHDIAGWLGVPTAVVIVAMVMLRKYGKQMHARRRQTRAERARSAQT